MGCFTKQPHPTDGLVEALDPKVVIANSKSPKILGANQRGKKNSVVVRGSFCMTTPYPADMQVQRIFGTWDVENPMSKKSVDFVE